MLFTAIPPLLAPHTTGHPAALPPDTARHNPDTRITAPKAGDASGNTRGDQPFSGDTSHRPETERRRPPAPPTLLQLKINSLLEEQQAKQAQEKSAPQTPAPTTPVPEAAAKDADALPGDPRNGPEPEPTEVPPVADPRPSVADPRAPYADSSLTEAAPEHALTRSV